MLSRSGSLGCSCCLARSEAVGSCSGIECVSTGMVIINTISSTSITSTSGVTLMSDIGASSPEFIEPKAMV